MFFDAEPSLLIGPVSPAAHPPRRVEPIHGFAPTRVLQSDPRTVPIAFDAFLRDSEQFFPLQPYWSYIRRLGGAVVEGRARAHAPRPRPSGPRLGDVSPTRVKRTEQVYRLVTRIERPLKLGSVIDEIV